MYVYSIPAAEFSYFAAKTQEGESKEKDTHTSMHRATSLCSVKCVTLLIGRVSDIEDCEQDIFYCSSKKSLQRACELVHSCVYFPLYRINENCYRIESAL